MSLGSLLLRDLGRSPVRLLGVGGAVAASVAVLILLGGVALGLERFVLGPLLPRLPLEYLKVEPKTLSLGLLAFDTGGLGGGLDAETIEEIEALEGVAEVHPVWGARIPLRAEGGEGFLGRRLRTDIFATGVSRGLVDGEVAPGESFEDRPDAPVPVIVARRLLELYNTTVAPAIEKPRLSERAVVGFEFLIQVGRSFSGGTAEAGKVRTVRARVVGLSDRASLVGVTVPEATMKRWNAGFGKDSVVTGAWVRVRAPEYVGPVGRRIERRGLRVDDTPKLIGATLTVGRSLFGLFGALLLGLATFAIAQTFFLVVAERRLDLAILRAVGARRRDLARLVLQEAMLVGLAGALVGMVVGSALAKLLDTGVRSALPDLPFQPEAVVDLPIGLLAGAVAIGTLASVLGASIPAYRASRADPGTALRS